MCKKIQFRFPQTYIEGLQGNMRHFVIDSLHDGSKAFFCSETERQKKGKFKYHCNSWFQKIIRLPFYLPLQYVLYMTFNT